MSTLCAAQCLKALTFVYKGLYKPGVMTGLADDVQQLVGLRLDVDDDLFAL